MSKRKAVDIRQDDYFRVLLTETTPTEVPLFCSNVGLYTWARKNLGHSTTHKPRGQTLANAVVTAILRGPQNGKPTQPYEYEVRVRPTKQRRLAIAHPRAQLNWVELYKSRHPLLLHFCSRSEWSLRAPSQVASRTYVSNPDEDLYKLKLNAAGVDVDSDHWRHRHAASFFSYRGHRRLYRFFESEEFLRLEQRFPTLWMLDINNCFGSIYTHSISWATSSKAEVKRDIPSSEHTFGGELDRSLRNANWAETGGILIGPELSRIFAEIILQDVDIRVRRNLQEHSFRDQYVIRRYVDDYFVFAADEVVAEQIVRVIEHELAEYNLHLNISKTTKYARPFITEKSRAIELAKVALNDLESAIMELDKAEEEPDANIEELTRDEQAALDEPIDSLRPRKMMRPRTIRSIRRLKASAIRKLKVICAENAAGYDLVGGYVFPALVNLLVKLYEADAKEVAQPKQYARAAQLVLELLYFLYSVSPSVGHSVRLANASLLSLSFFRASELVSETPQIEETVYKGCAGFLQESTKLRSRKSIAGLEELNIVTILGQLGSDYEIPWRILRGWIISADRPLCDLDYFALAVLLQYTRGRPDYSDARSEIGQAVIDKVSNADADTIENSSEYALLLLDFLSCPILEDSFRKKLLKIAVKKLRIRKPKSNKEVSEAVEWMESRDWFSDWDDVHLYRSLQRSNRTGFY